MASYFIKHKKQTVDEAYSLIKKGRPHAILHDVHLAALQKLYESIQSWKRQFNWFTQRFIFFQSMCILIKQKPSLLLTFICIHIIWIMYACATCATVVIVVVIELNKIIYKLFYKFKIKTELYRFCNRIDKINQDLIYFVKSRLDLFCKAWSSLMTISNR
jgi:hypothetical protein